MKYFIDGYNLLFYLFHTNEKLEVQRNLVIDFIKENSTFLNGKIYLIFDGHKNVNVIPSRKYLNNITIIYTPKNQTADEYIIEKLSFLSETANITVVTSDRSLKMNCVNLNAQTKSIDEFLEFLDKKKKTFKKNETFNFEENVEDTKEEIERLLKIFEEKYNNL
ncbi:MAG: hypothetical protein K1060chlam5_00955 [Candidatus Anoxychlamydiales bacterium]|nr:hypothetical protein [Candidatus Anoxychlamydiales bacterium]